MSPVANYEGMYGLDDRQLREWAVLDTFDMLSPQYDQPQTPERCTGGRTKRDCRKLKLANLVTSLSGGETAECNNHGPLGAIDPPSESDRPESASSPGTRAPRVFSCLLDFAPLLEPFAIL